MLLHFWGCTQRIALLLACSLRTFTLYERCLVLGLWLAAVPSLRHDCVVALRYCRGLPCCSSSQLAAEIKGQIPRFVRKVNQGSQGFGQGEVGFWSSKACCLLIKRQCGGGAKASGDVGPG